MSLISYLRKREWSMGNGQCPDCMGLDPLRWRIDHPSYTRSGVGHKPHCELALALRDVGALVVWAHCSLEVKDLPETELNKRLRFAFMDAIWTHLVERR